MDPARIAELLNPFLTTAHSVVASAGDEPLALGAASLGPAQIKQISTYIDILAHWNARINLTAVRRPEDMVTRHFGESLFAARHLLPFGGSDTTVISPGDVRRAAAPSSSAAPKKLLPDVIDVGSGAGFPGIPMKIWAPAIHLTLIEANHKKATFLREVARTLTFTNVNVFAVRAEALQPRAPRPSRAKSPAPPPYGKASIVTLRAVERFHSVLPLASNLVSAGGRLALLLGEAQVPTSRSMLPTFQWRDPLPIPLSKRRVLLVGSPK